MVKKKKKLFVWEDETNYSRGDKDRTPRAWCFNLSEYFSVYLHRKIYFEGDWFLSCNELRIEDYPLNEEDVDMAKAEALAEVRDSLNKRAEETAALLKKLNKFEGKEG
jgi:hypothetical protein